MAPAGLQEKMSAFVDRRLPVIADLIKRTIAGGLSPEDHVFVIPAEDAASQRVTAIMFGLEKEAAAGPLPRGFTVGKAAYFASVGRVFERYEPNICGLLRRQDYGKVKVLGVVDGCFCGFNLMYLPQG